MNSKRYLLGYLTSCAPVFASLLHTQQNPDLQSTTNELVVATATWPLWVPGLLIYGLCSTILNKK